MKKGETWQTKYALQLSKRISDPRVNAVLETTQNRRESRKSDTSDDGRPRNATSRKSFVRQNSESSLDNSTTSDMSGPPSGTRNRAIPDIISTKVSLKNIPKTLMRATSTSALVDTLSNSADNDDNEDKVFIAPSLSRALSSPLLLEKMSDTDSRLRRKILKRNSTYTILENSKTDDSMQAFKEIAQEIIDTDTSPLQATDSKISNSESKQNKNESKDKSDTSELEVEKKKTKNWSLL